MEITRRSVTTMSLTAAAAAIMSSGHLPGAAAAVFPRVKPHWHPGQVVTGTGVRAVAFTFDDGPRNGATQAILAFLAERQLKATFCMIGSAVATSPAVARQVHAAGMEIANHTCDHSMSLGQESHAAIERDIRRTQDVIHSEVGVIPRVFRAPGGASTPRILDVLRNDFHHMMPLGWSVESRDWSRPGTEQIVTTVTTEVSSGAIIVFHDLNGCSAETLAALPVVYDHLVRRGHTFTQVVG